MTEVASYLATKLYEEKLPVTYRMLSRDLSIDVRRSKEELAEFHKKDEALEAIYIVSGFKDGLGIKLVNKNDLDSVKKECGKVLSMACYSLSTSGVSAQEVANMEGMRRHKWLSPDMQRKLGIIQGPSGDEQFVEEQEVEPVKQEKPKESVSVKPATKHTIEPANTQTPKATKKAENVPTITSKYVSRKQENNKAPVSVQKTIPTSKANPKSKPSFSYVSRKEPKESIVVGEVEEDNSFPLNEPVRKKTPEEIIKEKEELAAMFSDSDDEMADTQVIQQDSVPIKEDDLFVIDDEDEQEANKDQAQAKKEANPEDQMDVDLDSDFDTSVQEINPPIPSNEPPQGEEEQPTEEVTSYVDEDGFITTVRNTKIKTDKPLNPKPSPAVGSVKGKSSAKKSQSTLMSFFGKK